MLDNVCRIVRQTESSTWRRSSAFARRAGSVRTAQADSVTSTAENMEGESRNYFILIKIEYFPIHFLKAKLGEKKKNIFFNFILRCEDTSCVCADGWTGARCQDRGCDPRCSLHGQCKNGTCLCVTGWNGIHCTLEGCPKACASHGTCKANLVNITCTLFAFQRLSLKAFLFDFCSLCQQFVLGTVKIVIKYNKAF